MLFTSILEVITVAAVAITGVYAIPVESDVVSSFWVLRDLHYKH